MAKPVRVYSPDMIARGGWPVLRGMIGEQVASRELTWRLFVRDLSAKYKQSVLGFLWAFLNLVATVTVFVLLNRSGVLDIGRTSISYPAYALLRITVWQLFAAGLTTEAGALWLAASGRSSTPDRHRDIATGSCRGDSVAAGQGAAAHRGAVGR